MATKKSASKPAAAKQVADLTHSEAKRKNIPTVEHQSVMQQHEQAPVKVAYPRANRQWLTELRALHEAGKASPEWQQRLNRDLDPQLIWRGKDQQDWSDLVVNAPPLYIQEKVKPKALIDDLRRQTEARREAAAPQPDMLDLFGDFNGLPEGADRTEFYQHEGHWQNRMILGDSLQVMASLAEREGLRGKVQCIYFDPPYGIKFNSNFQWSTTSRDVKDGNADHITREPEQVKAFRDTWRDGIHSYLTYLRDRLMVARDLLTESGSIFVQIGDENVHRVRAVMDEVFGEENFLGQIPFMTTGGQSTAFLSSVADILLWYANPPVVVTGNPPPPSPPPPSWPPPSFPPPPPPPPGGGGGGPPPPPPPPVETGLGDVVDELVNSDGKVSNRLRSYLSEGRTIVLADLGDRRGVVEDSIIYINSALNNDYLIAAVIAHELEHWVFPPSFSENPPPRDSYINTMLNSEGSGMLEQMRFIRTVGETHPNLNSVTMPDGSFDVYDQYVQSQITSEQATQQLGQIYGNLTVSDGRTWAQVLGDLWDDTYNPPPP